jgi:hypothetical protein
MVLNKCYYSCYNLYKHCQLTVKQFKVTPAAGCTWQRDLTGFLTPLFHVPPFSWCLLELKLCPYVRPQPSHSHTNFLPDCLTLAIFSINGNPACSLVANNRLCLRRSHSRLQSVINIHKIPRDMPTNQSDEESLTRITRSACLKNCIRVAAEIKSLPMSSDRCC